MSLPKLKEEKQWKKHMIADFYIGTLKIKLLFFPTLFTTALLLGAVHTYPGSMQRK